MHRNVARCGAGAAVAGCCLRAALAAYLCYEAASASLAAQSVVALVFLLIAALLEIPLAHATGVFPPAQVRLLLRWQSPEDEGSDQMFTMTACNLFSLLLDSLSLLVLSAHPVHPRDGAFAARWLLAALVIADVGVALRVAVGWGLGQLESRPRFRRLAPLIAMGAGGDCCATLFRWFLLVWLVCAEASAAPRVLFWLWTSALLPAASPVLCYLLVVWWLPRGTWALSDNAGHSCAVAVAWMLHRQCDREGRIIDTVLRLERACSHSPVGHLRDPRSHALAAAVAAAAPSAGGAAGPAVRGALAYQSVRLVVDPLPDAPPPVTAEERESVVRLLASLPRQTWEVASRRGAHGETPWFLARQVNAALAAIVRGRPGVLGSTAFAAAAGFGNLDRRLLLSSAMFRAASPALALGLGEWEVQWELPLCVLLLRSCSPLGDTRAAQRRADLLRRMVGALALFELLRPVILVLGWYLVVCAAAAAPPSAGRMWPLTAVGLVLSLGWVVAASAWRVQSRCSSAPDALQSVAEELLQSGLVLPEPPSAALAGVPIDVLVDFAAGELEATRLLVATSGSLLPLCSPLRRLVAEYAGPLPVDWQSFAEGTALEILDRFKWRHAS